MKKIKNIILTLILMFTVVGVVKAEDLINQDTIKIKVEGLDEFDQQSAYLRIYDAGFNSEKSYVATFTKDKQSVKEEISNDEDHTVVSDLPIDEQTIKNAGFTSSDYLSYAEKYGDVYVTFYVSNSEKTGYFKKISEPILVEKPENLKLSRRFTVFPWEDSTSLYYNNLGSILTNRTVNYKLGKVTNTTILNKIKNNDYSGLEDLLILAKNDQNSISTGKMDLDSSIPSLFAQTDLIEDAYYYIYLELDDENGKYYELEDVSLYQCLNSKEGLWLANMDNESFKWQDTRTLWERYVEQYKSTEIMKSYAESSVSVDIKSTDATLNSTIDDGTVKLIGNFNYNNGIVSYVPLDDKAVAFETIFNEDVMIENAIVALANLKGYDVKKFKTWLYENEGKLSLEKDGIEYTLEDYTKNQDNGVTLTVKKVKAFNFKLDHEVKINASAENPKTGLKLNYKLLLGIIIIGGIVYTVIRKKSKFPKHN